MEVKIKNNNEMIDATIEMVDGVMVVSPKEVKFEPKDGDVIVSGGDTRFVAIFNKMKCDYAFFYYALLVLDGNKRPQINNWASFLNVRPATEEEKKLLFDKLAEEGLAWDAERKELFKIKWKPKVGEDFYYPFFKGFKFVVRCFSYDRKESIDEDEEIQSGKVFKTKKECQAFCSRLNDAISQVKP